MCVLPCGPAENFQPASVQVDECLHLSRKRVCEVSWAPGAGVPCYSFGREDMKQRNEFLLHTSLLYSELEVALKHFSCKRAPSPLFVVLLVLLALPYAL